MTTVILGILAVVVSVALAVTGLVLTQRLTPLEVRESHNAATGTIYAALYVVFGVALGFSLLLVHQQFDEARRTVEKEAGAVEQVYEISDRFPEPDRSRVQDLTVSYVRTVVEDEWPAMALGQDSPRASRLAGELEAVILNLDPRGEAQTVLYAEALARLDDLNENRALRLLEVRERLPSIMWFVLVAGGTLTVAFTYLFGMHNLRLHALGIAALTTLLVLVLFTIGVLDHPFDGDVRVGPDAFEMVLREIEGTGQR